uniref:F-box domain-containing protein n=1 Tax=Timema tahoe TaxID=61484 RepID=A0A7R9ISP7_9NEOP|nr:unnamed protein product [Timema tahoe]
MEDDFDSQDNLFLPETTSLCTLLPPRYFMSQSEFISLYSWDNVAPSFDLVPRSPLKCDEPRCTSSSRSTENIPNSSSPFVKQTSEDAAPIPGSSRPNLTLGLDELPPDVMEIILSFLTFKEVASLRVLCRQVHYSCGRIIRIGFRRLERAIDKRLNLLRSEIAAISDTRLVNRKVLLYRCYNVLEMLRAELRMVIVLCRSVLQDEDKCFPGGNILDHFYSVLHKVDIQDIPQWTVESNVTCQLLTTVKRFLEGYQRHCDSVPLGVRVVDLLDILVGADYSLNILYDPRAGTCHVGAVYELCNAKFLTYPLNVLNKETVGARLTAEEIQSLAAYYVTTRRFGTTVTLSRGESVSGCLLCHNGECLEEIQSLAAYYVTTALTAYYVTTVSLSRGDSVSSYLPRHYGKCLKEIQSPGAYYGITVRYNNRLLLREEQYRRECKLSRFIQTSPGTHDISSSSGAKSNLCRPPREYSSRVCQERVVLSSDDPVVSETYLHHSGKQPHLHGLRCGIDLTCSLGEAPLEVLRAWNKLSSPIGSVSSPVEEERLATIKQQEHCWPIEDEASNIEYTSSAPRVSVYSVTGDLRIVLPDTESADEIYKLVFRDGRSH